MTRYSFHHLLQPGKALREMIRVCRNGGRIVVCDVTPEEGKTEAYERLEKMRDYRMEISLDAQLASSFPPPGHAEIIRELVRRDIGLNKLSVDALESGDDLILRLPVSIAVWKKR